MANAAGVGDKRLCPFILAVQGRILGRFIRMYHPINHIYIVNILCYHQFVKIRLHPGRSCQSRKALNLAAPHFFAPLFSITSTILFPQLLSFHIHAKNTGAGWGPKGEATAKGACPGVAKEPASSPWPVSLPASIGHARTPRWESRPATISPYKSPPRNRETYLSTQHLISDQS
jgi:hypothetical protein